MVVGSNYQEQNFCKSQTFQNQGFKGSFIKTNQGIQKGYVFTTELNGKGFNHYFTRSNNLRGSNDQITNRFETNRISVQELDRQICQILKLIGNIFKIN